MSIADEIKKLKELLDEGVITRNEFDKMKQELIPNTDKLGVEKSRGEIDKSESNNIPSQPNKKKSSGCFGSLAIIVAMIVISIIINLTGEKNGEKIKLTAEEQNATYIEDLKPKIDEIIKEADTTHSDFWSATLLNLSEGTLTSTDAYKNLEAGEKRYSQLSPMISALDGDFLSKENQNLLNGFKKAYTIVAIKRQQAHSAMSESLNEGRLKPETEARIQKLIEESDVALTQSVLKLTELEAAIGVKRE